MRVVYEGSSEYSRVIQATELGELFQQLVNDRTSEVRFTDFDGSILDVYKVTREGTTITVLVDK